jgi:hypothetical protein
MKCRQFISLPLFALFLLPGANALAGATWYVNGVDGGDSNDCLSAQTPCKTIGHAISLASSGDSIMVAAATYTENLTIGLSVNVIGSGASTTIIDANGGSVVTVSVVTANVTLSNLTIRGGNAFKGGGILNNGALTINNSTITGNSALSWGGGIFNSGTLRVMASTLSGNTVSNTCYSYCLAIGGGLYNQGGTVTISNSTLDHNRAVRYCNSGCRPSGGAIGNGGTMTITNSTISANIAVVDFCIRGCMAAGGGIESNGTLTINNSTISGNSAVGKDGPGGGGIFGNVILQNSIVANSPSGGNCSGTMTSKGYNLSSDSTCNLSGSGDLNNIDPKLGVLQNNGGPTQTIALLSGSPAIDAGNPSGCTDAQGHLLTTDQRGMPRPDPGDTGRCDMGAYEAQGQ